MFPNEIGFLLTSISWYHPDTSRYEN